MAFRGKCNSCVCAVQYRMLPCYDADSISLASLVFRLPLLHGGRKRRRPLRRFRCCCSIDSVCPSVVVKLKSVGGRVSGGTFAPESIGEGNDRRKKLLEIVSTFFRVVLLAPSLASLSVVVHRLGSNHFVPVPNRSKHSNPPSSASVRSCLRETVPTSVRATLFDATTEARNREEYTHATTVRFRQPSRSSATRTVITKN